MTWLPEAGSTPPRVAYAVGRQAGAVARNRLRRRLRAVVTDAAAELRPGAYLVGAGPEADELSPPALREAILDALQAAHGRHE